MIIIRQLYPGNDSPGEWREIGKATTWKGAERIAKRKYTPRSFGDLRHPDGGPLYGTIHAIENKVKYAWDSVGFFVPIDLN